MSIGLIIAPLLHRHQVAPLPLAGVFWLGMAGALFFILVGVIGLLCEGFGDDRPCWMRHAGRRLESSAWLGLGAALVVLACWIPLAALRVAGWL